MTKPKQFVIQSLDPNQGEFQYLKSNQNDIPVFTRKVNEALSFTDIDIAAEFAKKVSFTHCNICEDYGNKSYTHPTKTFVWNNNYRLTEDEFNHLLNEDISKKDYDQLLKKVNIRFFYILEKISETLKFSIDWFDFSNTPDSDDIDDGMGHFTSKMYKENISFCGKFKNENKTIPFQQLPFSDQFPTTWLKTNFEVELKSTVDEYIKNQQKTETNKKIEHDDFLEKIKEMQSQIFSKLTEEEQQFIGMLSPEKIAANLNKLTIEKNKRKFKKK